MIRSQLRVKEIVVEVEVVVTGSHVRHQNATIAIRLVISRQSVTMMPLKPTNFYFIIANDSQNYKHM